MFSRGKLHCHIYYLLVDLSRFPGDLAKRGYKYHPAECLLHVLALAIFCFVILLMFVESGGGHKGHATVCPLVRGLPIIL